MTRSERRAFQLAYAAWLLGVFAFFIPAATWNPVSRFNLTRSLVERGSLIVDPYVTSTGDRAQVGDHFYSDKAPVVAFLAVPAYAAVYAVETVRGTLPDYRAYATPSTPAQRVIPNRAYQQALYACSLSTSGVAAIAIALLLFTLIRRRASSRVAFLGSSLTVLGTPILPYATSLYGHVPAAALILGGVTLLDPRAPSGPPSRRDVRLAGLCLALAPGCEYLTAVPVAVVCGWFWLRSPSGQRFRRTVDVALGALLPVAFVALYLTLVFGAPWRTGYSFEERKEFAAAHASGLLGLHPPNPEALFGLTFGTRRGLFYLSPLMLVGAVRTLRMALRRRDFAAQLGIGIALALLLLNGGYYMWWGGAAMGPRHLIPGIPLLGLGVASAFRSKYRWLTPICVVLALWSVAQCVSATLVGIEAPEFGDVLRHFVWPRLREASFASANGRSNLGLKLGLSPVASIVPLVLWLVAGYAYLLVQTSSRVRPTSGRPSLHSGRLSRHGSTGLLGLIRLERKD